MLVQQRIKNRCSRSDYSNDKNRIWIGNRFFHGRKEIRAGIIVQVDTDVSVSFPDERKPRSNDDSPAAWKKSAAVSAMRLPEWKRASIPSRLNRSKPFAFDGRRDNFPWHDHE